jgi:acylphosphatase
MLLHKDVPVCLFPDAGGGGNSSARDSPPPWVACIQARVKGRVQGVGFRYWTEDVAQSLGVRGWVRNCDNGEVEVEAEGSREVLEEFCRRLHEGPVLARVRGVEVEWGERPARYSDFRIERGGWWR